MNKETTRRLDHLTKLTDLTRTVCQWEVRRENRKCVEDLYSGFTGTIDIVELHIPYTQYDCLRTLFAEDIDPARRMLVFGGDAVNLDMFSVFHGKSGDQSKPSDELKALVAILQAARARYGHILFLVTNHEERLKKVIQRNIEKDVADEVLKLLETFQSLFSRAGLGGVVVVEDWFVQIGDAVISHMENNSTVAGTIVRNIIQYLTPRLTRSWNIVFQLHTHCQSKIPIDCKVGVETGTLAETMDYWRSGKMYGRGKMSTSGYGRCVMKRGKADLNLSGFVIWNWEGRM